MTARGAVPIVRRARKRVADARGVVSLGAVAQLGERRVRNAKVRGSIPLGSTNSMRRKYPSYFAGGPSRSGRWN